jgi:membrane protein DedA with SNARE-associated domain
MADRAIFIVLGIFFGALLLVALGKVLWDRRPKKMPRWRRRRRSRISR